MADFFMFYGTPGTTFSKTVGDSDMTFSAGERPTGAGANITIQDNDVLVAFGASAARGSGAAVVGHHVSAGDSLFLDGPDAFRKAHFTNAASGSDAVLQVTPWTVT